MREYERRQLISIAVHYAAFLLGCLICALIDLLIAIL